MIFQNFFSTKFDEKTIIDETYVFLIIILIRFFIRTPSGDLVYGFDFFSELARAAWEKCGETARPNQVLCQPSKAYTPACRWWMTTAVLVLRALRDPSRPRRLGDHVLGQHHHSA